MTRWWAALLLTAAVVLSAACGVVVRQDESAERVDVELEPPDPEAQAAELLPSLPTTTVWIPPQVVATVPPSTPEEAAAPVLDPWCVSINSFIDVGYEFTSSVESSDAAALRAGIAKVAATAAALTVGAKPAVAGPAEKLREALASASAQVATLQDPEAMRAAVGQAMSSLLPLVDELLASASSVCSEIEARNVPS